MLTKGVEIASGCSQELKLQPQSAPGHSDTGSATLAAPQSCEWPPKEQEEGCEMGAGSISGQENHDGVWGAAGGTGLIQGMLSSPSFPKPAACSLPSFLRGPLKDRLRMRSRCGDENVNPTHPPAPNSPPLLVSVSPAFPAMVGKRKREFYSMSGSQGGKRTEA